MSDPTDPNFHLTRIARLRDVIVCAIGIVVICVGIIHVLSKGQPLVSAIAVGGVLLLPWVILSPLWGLLVFLWLAHTIDGVKRLAYAFSNFSHGDIASILIVPVLVAIALYVKMFFLKWFGDRSTPPVRMFKFLPLVICMIGATIFTLHGGLDFSALTSNYSFICYIPAGIAVPYILCNTQRRLTYVKTLIVIGIVVGSYGLIQALHGPFEYERAYLYSGLTQTISAIDGQLYFRSFSLLNNGPTFGGVLMMITLLSYFYFCRKKGRLHLNRNVILMTLFTITASFAATQRGPIVSFLLTLCLLPLFTRPRAFLVAIFIGLTAFVGVIYFAEDMLEWLVFANDRLASSVDSAFLQQNANILTYGQRLNGFTALANPALWTPFGTMSRMAHSDIMANNVAAGHDLISNFLEWFGYVGTGIFLLLLAGMLIMVIKRTRFLLKNPERALWAQCNLGVFLFMMIWQLFTGPAMHVSPLQFYFWVAIGNLNYLLTESDFNRKSVSEKDIPIRRITSGKTPAKALYGRDT